MTESYVRHVFTFSRHRQVFPSICSTLCPTVNKVPEPPCHPSLDAAPLTYTFWFPQGCTHTSGGWGHSAPFTHFSDSCISTLGVCQITLFANLH